MCDSIYQMTSYLLWNRVFGVETFRFCRCFGRHTKCAQKTCTFDCEYFGPWPHSLIFPDGGRHKTKIVTSGLTNHVARNNSKHKSDFPFFRKTNTALRALIILFISHLSY